MVERLQATIATGIEAILSKIGASTLQMIGTDSISYPEHRLNYFTLISNIVQHCFQCISLFITLVALYVINPVLFKTLIDSILWAIKHQEPNIADIGLNTLQNLMTNLSNNKMAFNQFLVANMMEICKDIFIVLTDSLHKSGFSLQTKILSRLILAIESKEVTDLLNPSVPDNKHYLREYLISALATSFPNMSKTNVMSFVDSLFLNCTKWEVFKTAVRDFLITMKEFADDSELLYSEERLVRNII